LYEYGEVIGLWALPGATLKKTPIATRTTAIAAGVVGRVIYLTSANAASASVTADLNAA
jgi:hypothetical protein